MFVGVLPLFRLAATLVGTSHGLFVASNAVDSRSACVDGDLRCARVCTTTYLCCRYIMIGFGLPRSAYAGEVVERTNATDVQA